jgi:hypothetical protein
MKKTPDDLRRDAADQERIAAESWERSDTDGFLTQWAADISARLLRAQARLEEEGGLSSFVELFDLNGEWVRSKVIRTRFGIRRMIVDPKGRSMGIFLPHLPARRATLAAKGYLEGVVLRRAKAEIAANGSGLSGAATARVVIVPEDPMSPPDEILSTDRWATEEGKGS